MKIINRFKTMTRATSEIALHILVYTNSLHLCFSDSGNTINEPRFPKLNKIRGNRGYISSLRQWVSPNEPPFILLKNHNRPN